ncbi:MAG TPA: FHA domain-containing protein [Vicinamibacteria bacterium]|nr:FHA domain-containing protein [Vicinamibacteria bacterium]
MIAIRLLRDGAVVREAIVDRLPATLGRGPQCDFVLADPSVSRLHARLERDAEGRLVLVDVGSVNGLHAGPTRVSQLSVDATVHCRLGAAEIEIEKVSDDATVEVRPELWHRYEQRRSLGHHALYLGLGVLGFALRQVLDPGFWSPWQRSRASELVGSLVGALVLLPVLAFLLFVALKAAGRPVRVADTLRALARLAWLMPLWFLLVTAADYALGAGAQATATALITWAVALGAIVHAATLRRPGRRRGFALAWAAAVTALWAGGQLATAMGQRRMGVPQNDYAVRPPLGGFTGRATDLDRYLERVRARSSEAAAAVEEVRRSQDGG